MKKTALLFTVVVLCDAYHSCAAIPDTVRQYASQCGINSLYSCLRYLDLDPSLTQMYADITPNEDYQVNLHQLTQYARQHGAIVWAVRRPTLSTLRKYLHRDSCALVQFQRADGRPHMASLWRLGNGGIVFVDVPHRRFVPSESVLHDLLSRSRGLLILSRRPIRASLLDRTDNVSLWIGISTVGLGLLGIVATLAWNKVRIPDLRRHRRSGPNAEDHQVEETGPWA